jgi:hypothetical protein
MLLESITAIAAKIAGANTVAQAAAGLGIAVAGVTGAGAAGILPGPVQDGVAGAIEAVTPFEAPDSGDVTAPVRPTDVTPVVSTEAPAPAAATPTPTGRGHLPRRAGRGRRAPRRARRRPARRSRGRPLRPWRGRGRLRER